jgi:hypothetical protein
MKYLFNEPQLVFITTLILLWFASWVGMFLRNRFRQLSDGTREDYGLIVGATLTLLGLIIGFTFSMATTRYDLRKSLEEEEANAIGTEYARVDFLRPEDSVQLKTLLREYADLRVRFYLSRDRQELVTVNRATAVKQDQLWAAVSQSAKLDPNQLVALAASGMNDVLNSQGYTQAAWWNRIPVAAWGLMYAIAILSNLLLGYGAHGRAVLLSIILPLVVAISFFLIADIDSPRGGIIRVKPQNLTALVDSWN